VATDIHLDHVFTFNGCKIYMDKPHTKSLFQENYASTLARYLDDLVDGDISIGYLMFNLYINPSNVADKPLTMYLIKPKGNKNI
jgi:hypothetical protein